MFDYIIEKIFSHNFKFDPFKHLEVDNFLKESHFNDIINDKRIKFKQLKNFNDLFLELKNKNYELIGFPGTSVSENEFLNNLGKKNINDLVNNKGLVYRLIFKKKIFKSTLDKFNDFVNSAKFIECLKSKFEISRNIRVETGFQKYLTNYEISPHPDIKSKSLTFMLNINPSPKSEEINFHTQYLTFKENYKFITSEWEKNIDRCWVPWSWCELIKSQKRNNSIIIFQPNSHTLHAIKASYNCLLTQRTQFYGNFWDDSPEYKNLTKPDHNHFKKMIKSNLLSSQHLSSNN